MQPRYYVVDVYARSYYGETCFPDRDSALAAARQIKHRPFGVWIARSDAWERIYSPLQDM